MLNEKEASQLSDTEFKVLVIRKLNELTEHYQKLQGNYNELTANYINMKKEIETINKGQKEMKNTISELRKTVEGSINVWDDGEENDDEEAMLHVQHKFSFLDSWVPKAILL